MCNTEINFKKFDPFLAPFSNIPYMFNGTIGSMIKGASCFAYFILEHQRRKSDLSELTGYLFYDEEINREAIISSKISLEERLIKTENFLDKYFSFFRDYSYQNLTELFIFSSFLDQLGTDCYHYIEFREPTLKDYITAYKEIDLLADEKGFSKQEIKKYKHNLLDLLSVEKKNAYFGILFNAA